MAQLTCENLSFGYNGRPLLPPINFAIDPGDYLCIIGENGGGKSTLLKTLLGLQEPLSGRVVLDGLDASQIGYLPQQNQIQRDFPATVREIVLSGCQARSTWRPFYNREERQLADSLMDKVNILNLAKVCYSELSGGQQQRVLLARALCAARKLLFLDEPVAGLDPEASKRMYDLIRRLNKEDGISIIMVSHDLGPAVNEASHILHLGKDRQIFADKSDYLASNWGRSYFENSGNSL